MYTRLLLILAAAVALTGCGVAASGESGAAETTPQATQSALVAPEATATVATPAQATQVPQPTHAPEATQQQATQVVPTTAPTTEETPMSGESASQPDATSGAEAQPAVSMPTALSEQIKNDLAGRAAVEASAITVKSVEETEWNNSSLGCPKKGVAYMQVITPGYRIILEANGQTYEYHTDAGKRFVFCEPMLGQRQ